MFAFSTCDKVGNTEVYRGDGPKKRRVSYRERLETIWARRNRLKIEKICHNARFDCTMTASALDMPLSEMRQHTIHETMALSHLYNNRRRSHSLDQLSWELLKHPRDLDDAVHQYKRLPGAMKNCPEFLCDKYQRADVRRAMLLYLGLSKKVKDMGLWDIYRMECDLVWTTMAIESRGMYLDEKRANKLQDELRVAADKALEDFQAIVGKRVDLNDNTVRRVLFETMDFPVIKMTDTDLPSVDKFVLGELKKQTGHPIFDAILKCKSYRKGVTSIESYKGFADAGGIIRPNIHPYKASTSRQACTRPNLHNVEREDRFVNPFPIPARRAFGPEPGYVNYHIDYAGIQVRQAVHYSQDPEFLRIFREGGDPHHEAAKEFYGSRYTNLKMRSKKQKLMRGAAKNGNFEVIFAGGMDTLAHTLGLPRAEIAPGWKRYKARFSKMADLNRRDSADVRANGHVVTAFGRILRVARNKAYVGTNHRIQGGEAGVLKRAEIRVDNYLTEATGDEVGIILPVHDELIIRCPRGRIRDFEHDCLPKVRELMMDFPEFSLPLEVEAEVSIQDWTKKKPVTIRRRD